MSDLTPEKIAKLTALMASAPPEAASRLFDMFERLNVKGSEVIPSGVLMGALRDAGKANAVEATQPPVRLPSFERMFFEPFESLFENSSLEQVRPGGVPRAGLSEAWQVIVKHFAPKNFDELKTSATKSILAGDLYSARAMAQQIRTDVLANLKSLNNDDIASLATSPASQAFLMRLAPLLLAHARGHELWSLALDRKGVLSETGVEGLCTKVHVLNVNNADAAREMLLLTTSILATPCEALKVFNKAVVGVKDHKIDEADFGIVCRRIIRLAKDAADLIEQATSTTIFDGAKVASDIKGPLQILHGLEREALTMPDSPLCQELLVVCRKAGTKLVEVCERTKECLNAALRVDLVKSYANLWVHKPRFDDVPQPDHIEAAGQYIVFLVASRSLKPIGEFGTTREQTWTHVTTYLNDVCEDLLRAARRSGLHVNHPVWVQRAARIVQALKGQTAADAFEKQFMTPSAESLARRI